VSFLNGNDAGNGAAASSSSGNAGEGRVDRRVEGWGIAQKLIPLYAAAVLAACVVFLLVMPILGGDTDTWFHLAMGRQISQTGTIPTAAFFSFIESGDDTGDGAAIASSDGAAIASSYGAAIASSYGAAIDAGRRTAIDAGGVLKNVSRQDARSAKNFKGDQELLAASAPSRQTSGRTPGIDYYWLFQWLIYNIYRLGGGWGAGALVLFRALVYSLTVFFIYLCLRGRDVGLGRAAAAALVIYAMTLLLRGLIIRPHMMNYLLIAVFLYIMEENPKAAPALPLLSILWYNLHGIEYPVPILITVSYLAGYAVKRVRTGRGSAPGDLPVLLSLTLSAAAVFLTPAGRRLLALPFKSTEYAATYVAELSPLAPADLFTFFVSPGQVSPHTINAAAAVMVILCAAAAAIRAIQGATVRVNDHATACVNDRATVGVNDRATACVNDRATACVNVGVTAAQVIMFVGGAFLLTKGMRFINEFILLGLPMVRAAVRDAETSHFKETRAGLRVVLIALVMLIPPVYLRTAHGIFSAYPYAAGYYPEATVRFITIYGGNGKILTDATAGGYYIFKLYPRFKIFMNLDMTCFFGDEDFFLANNVFHDPEVLRKFIARYHPEFIAAPATIPSFGRLIKEHPRYVPVFLDDSGVLYADKESLPDVAAAFEIKSFDAFEILSARYELPEVVRAEDIMVELNRLRSIYPSTVAVNRTLGALDNANGRYADALAIGQAIVASNPRLAEGWAIKGDALTGLKRYAEAAESFQEALERIKEGDRPPVYKKLSLCHWKLGDLKNAYRAFKKAVNIFDPGTDYVSLYTLALMAESQGRGREASMLYRFALEKIPPDNKQWADMIKAKLAGSGGK
jgi:tetratricopeptide (TPR) repeat protein